MKTENLSTSIVIQKIANLVRNMMDFWKNADGWAPMEAAHLLNKSMLDWQSSLADCLGNWNRPLTDGELILAWANVGALVEGQLKLFLSVYYEDYEKDVNSIKKKGVLTDPDAVSFEALRVFFEKTIWDQPDDWNKWISLIQQRRNTIHAYKFREIGSTEELHLSFSKLLQFTRMINGMLPYPDDVSPPGEF